MKVVNLAIKPRPRAPMQLCDELVIDNQQGIHGDSPSNRGDRQITLLSARQWQHACQQLGVDLPWTFRRANILIDEVQFGASWMGKTLRINDVELQVTEETEPCKKMDQQHQGLRDALTPDWRGGLCCRVIKGGTIRIGSQLLTA